MVSSVTSLTGNGLRDWLIQRVSAVVLGAYVIFLLAFIVGHPVINYEQWRSLFANPFMKISSVIMLLCLILHAWVGIWTVTTDYLKNTAIRLSVQMLVLLTLLASFVWGIAIFWGI